MSARPAYQLTPEQLAIQAERKRKKDEAKFKPKPAPSAQTASWNLLAQTLVRRELFPTSDCLKQSQRDPMTFAELLVHNADILCLQEVDRLDKILPILNAAGYSHTYTAGPRKLHGCMIVHRESHFEKIGERSVLYDSVAFGELQDGSPRAGIGRVTKNVGLVVALRDKFDARRGCLVATTHLFWHPSYVYERVRQSTILLREVTSLRAELGYTSWPCFVIGDFNFPPTDATYALMVGSQWSTEQESSVSKSRVVHVSIDPTVDSGVAPEDDDEGGGGQAEGNKETDPDRIIVNCRAPRDTDGLLKLDELLAMAPRLGLRSAYDEALRSVLHGNAEATLPISVFHERENGPPSQSLGAFEPMFTSYTHYWKATLDYLFMLDGDDGDRRVQPQAVRVLAPLTREAMEPGLPKLGICASDHVSLAADIVF
ncbi:Endonuclease/exonuclease/phosphatase [Auriculariales sp. MPI-PUGE-AT-0066]|nr:Endonuclease/exonuclease/phosphatase [Auriculariales sp. MPI-PUGE-AT-0066]